MSMLTKIIFGILVMFLGFVRMPLVDADCGFCGADKPKKHDHSVACVQCAHAKVCDAEECDDPDHEAACVCVTEEAPQDDI